MALCKADAQDGTPTVQDMERAAVQGLVDAYEPRRFTETAPGIREGV